MSDDTYVEKEQAHISNTVYLIVGGFLIVLTAMEITVAYVHALRPVMVPILVVLAIAKFALIAMFFMHLRYEKWIVNIDVRLPADHCAGSIPRRSWDCFCISRVTWLGRRSAFTISDHELD